MTFYKKHLFFCTNKRQPGKKCCEDAHASEMRHYAKKRIKALSLAGFGGVRVNIAGCLGRCACGPCLVVYPDAVWYTYANAADIDEIIEKHILQNQIVTRLVITS